MVLRRYALLFWHWLWLILLGAVLGGGAAYFVSKQQVPVYEASTTLLVSQGKAAVMDPTASYYDADRLAATYSQLMSSRPVLEEVVKNLSFVTPIGAVRAQPLRNTRLLQLTVEDTDPARAAAIANEIPQVFIRQNEEMQTRRFAEAKRSIQRQLDDTQSQMARLSTNIAGLQAMAQPDQAEIERQQRDLAQLQQSYTSLFQSYQGVRVEEARQLDTLVVTEPAEAPLAPIRPKTIQNTLLAAIVGAMLALGIAYVVEYLDDVIKNPEEAQATLGLAALGSVPVISHRDLRRGLPMATNTHSSAAEAYRVLRTNLQFAAVGKPLRSLLVTSPTPGEGKSITVANLGAAMAQGGKRVTLVDADLHRARLHQIFKLPNNVGITTALVEDGVVPADLLNETSVPNLRVLTSGPLPPNPAELLGTSRMREMLAELQSGADVLIIDSPPTTAVSDAAVLAAEADGVLLVLDATRTRRDVARRAVAALQHVQARLVGVVLNRLPTREAGSYYAPYSSHYGSQNGSGGAGGHSEEARPARPAPGLARAADRADEASANT